MADLGTGYVDVLPRTDTFLGALKGQMADVFKNAQSSLASVTKSFTAVQTAAVGAGLIAATGIAKGISATQEWASEVRSLQRVTGLAAEDASKLAAAGDALGIPVSSLNTAFGLLAKNIENGSTNFDKYNIATKDATGNTLPFLDILGNISDQFATLQPGTEQAAFAMNVFGRSGKDLIPVLQRGSEGLQELYDNAQAAGLVMGQDTLDASKNLTLAQRDLGEAVKGASISLGESFVPVITEVVKVLTSLVELVQLIPKPVLAIGAAFTTFAAATIVAVKAVTALKSVAAGSLQSLLRYGPAMAIVTIGLIEAAQAVETFSISLQKVGQETGFTQEQLTQLDTKFAEGGLLKSSSTSLSEFLTHIDGVRDNVAGLATDLEPLIGKLGEVGLGAGQSSEFLVRMAGTMHDVTQGSIDQLTASITEHIEEIKGLQDAYGKGQISLEDFVAKMQEFGFSVPEATQIASSGLDSFGKHLDDAGKEVRNFAGMTNAALKEWSTSVKSTFESTFTNVGSTIKDTFDLTPKEAQKAFDEMLRAAVRFKADIAAVLALKPGTFGLNKQDMQAFEVWLTKQAPDVIDGFVHGTEAQQQRMINDWQGTIGAFNKATRGIDSAKLTADVSQATSTVQRWIAATEAQRITIQADVKFNAQQPRAMGGPIFPVGFAAGGSTDTVPAMLTPGEFVMRRSAVERIGVGTLQSMNAGGSVSEPAGSKPQQLDGAMRIYDWRTGLASLDAELSWEDTVRTR